MANINPVIPSGNNKLYPGELRASFVTQLFETDALRQAGKKNVIGGFTDQYIIPLFDAAFAFSADVATPTFDDSTDGTFGPTDRTLVLKPYMLKQKFDPRRFDTYHKFTQSGGPNVYKTLNPTVLAPVLNSVLGFTAEEHARLDLVGSISGGDYYDGVLTKMKAGLGSYANTVIVDLPNPLQFSTGGSNGNPTGVLGAFNLIKDTINANVNGEIRKAYYKSDWTWVVSPLTADLYADAQKNQPNKGVDFTSEGVMRFNGKPIIVEPGMPDNHIWGTYMANNDTSNFHVGVDDTSDESSIAINKYTPYSAEEVLLMRMKRDTIITKPQHSLLAYFA